jgi:hypothetical protein
VVDIFREVVAAVNQALSHLVQVVLVVEVQEVLVLETQELILLEVEEVELVQQQKVVVPMVVPES